jgi:molybdate transport system substrate-binding protein
MGRGGWVWCLLLMLGGPVLSRPAASAEPVVVLSAAAMSSTLEGLAAPLAARTGLVIQLATGTAGGVHDRLLAGEAADLVIAPPAQLQDLVSRGAVLADPAVAPLGAVRLGVAVRQGAPRPAIDTPDAARASFLAAPTLGVADSATGATTGVYFAKLLKAQGISDQLGSRIHVYADGLTAMRALAKGEVALAAGQISEIKPVPGVDLVGPLPDAWQLRTIYAAAISAHAANPARARQLLTFLLASESTPVFTANGFDRP